MDGLAAVSGFGIGAIVGLTGVGGGSLMTPLLIGAFRLDPVVAIGTDLWFAALTKSAGAWAHARHDQVDVKIVLRLLTGSLPAAAATIATLHLSNHSNAWAGTLGGALGLALLLTALTVARRGTWSRLGLKLRRWLPESRLPASTIAAGAVLGTLVSLTSVGAGAIGVTLILLLYPRLPTQRVIGTDIAHAVPLTLVAGIGHATLGHVDWRLLGALLVGSLPGIWVGTRLTRQLPERLTRALLCVSLVIAGLKVIR